jgi:signal transduction histidine kinase
MLVLIGAVAAVFADDLPMALDPDLSPLDASRPRIVGHPVVLGVQLALVGLHLAAAAGFARAARCHRDELLGWLAIASTLAAFARVNFFLFPSLYSEWVYTGDVFRTASALTVLVGVVRVVFAYERRLAQLAVFDERRRVARELHDGLAQELSYIKHQSEDLLAQHGAMPAAERLAAAADRALEESRFAIAALVRPVDASLARSLESAARVVAERGGAQVSFSGDEGTERPDDVREALTRVVREAVSNAVRHGGARNVALELRDDGPLTLRVRDDGQGFDPDARLRPDAFGLISMRERVEALGGTLAVTSRRGEGTTVEVRLP